MKHLIAAALTATLAVPSLTNAQTLDNVAEFDVAGVKLGMSHDQAVVALKGNNFAITSDTQQKDWEARLADEMQKRGYKGNRDGRVAGFTRAMGPQNESINVSYAVTPEGARVSSVDYNARPARVTKDAFTAGLRKKYGEPTADHGARKMYCMRGEKTCTPLFGTDELPHMKVEMDPYLLYSITLYEGKQRRSLRHNQFASALNDRAPKSSTTSF